MSSIKRLIFGRGIVETVVPNEPPVPIGNPVNFLSLNFPGIIPICSDIAAIYSSNTRLEQNVLNWLADYTGSSMSLTHMNYKVWEGLSTPPNGYYRFGTSRNIIRLSNGIVQEVQYCP